LSKSVESEANLARVLTIGRDVFSENFVIGLTKTGECDKFSLFLKKNKEHYYRWFDKLATNSNALRRMVLSQDRRLNNRFDNSIAVN
jgi:hypothetical protein